MILKTTRFMHPIRQTLKTLLLITAVVLPSVTLTGQVSAKQSDTLDEYGPRTFNVENKWTAIVAAYEPEIKAIDAAIAKLPDAKITKTVTFQGVKYQLGTYKGEPIVIFTTGISVPNAAMTMQMALDYFLSLIHI